MLAEKAQTAEPIVVSSMLCVMCVLRNVIIFVEENVTTINWIAIGNRERRSRRTSGRVRLSSLG